jgi:hypothetical protein
MEVVIILIVVGILCYVFYQNLPNTKFQKANTLFSSGNFLDAIKILESIFEKHEEAPAKLAECKLKQGQQANSKNYNDSLKFFNEVVDIKRRIPSNISKVKYELIEAKANLEIALINFNSALIEKSADVKIKYFKDNLRFIDIATKLGIESDFSKLRKKHSYEMSELYFQFGLHKEKINGLSEAIQNYLSAKDFASESSNNKILYNASIRIGICKIKEKPKNIEFYSFADFNKADQKYVHDFFYRYVLYLIKKEAYTDAETILKTHLNLPTNTIEKLKELLKTKQIKQAIGKVEEINDTIELLYKKSFPVDQVKFLYDNLDIRINEIKLVIPNIAEKLKEFKPSLFNRLLSHYISFEEYGNAIELIQKYPFFWKNPELLKNLAICCYGYAANGNLNDKNYRNIISNWLTSVFSDHVILNSMEETSWDDKYTFTLIDAIGSNYKQHRELPDNANYDDITDKNISIGTTQRELLQQFESILQKTILDSSFSKAVNDFYAFEKESIQKIVSVINKDMLFAAPHFAKAYGINDEIIKELEKYYVNYSYEDSLDAGIPYLKNNFDTYVDEYSTAKETVASMISAIKNQKLNELKSVTTDKNRFLIQKYNSIYGLIEDSIFNTFTSMIERNDENEILIPLMEECIRFIKSNAKLKVQCSTYIHNYCDVMWKRMPAVKSLELLIKSIKYNPNNYRTAKSLTISINNNLMDIANDVTTSTSTTQIYALIEEVKKVRSEVLKDAFKELLVLRRKVLTSIGREGVAMIAVGYNLNSSGLKLKKVLDTMQILGGGKITNSLSDYI